MHQNLIVGNPFPLEIPSSECGHAEFLDPMNGNSLFTFFGGISEEESDSFSNGKIEVGMLFENGAILLLWRFKNKNGDSVLELDTPFYIGEIKDPNRLNIESNEERLLINIFLVDIFTRKLNSIRSITMPKETTLEFLSATQDQYISSKEMINNQIDKWQSEDLIKLFERAKMREMGL